MIDEWCERQVDRLCAFLPVYFGPRLIRMTDLPVVWRIYLYADAAGRWVGGLFSHIQWIEKLDPEEEERRRLAEEAQRAAHAARVAAYANLGPKMAEEMACWEEEQEQRERNRAQRSKEQKPLPHIRLKAWWMDRDKRAAAHDERACKRAKEREAHMEKRQRAAAPLMEAMRRGRFGATLLLMMLSLMAMLSTGAGVLGCVAASLCALWLSVAFEQGYEPVCGAVRQRYVTAVLLRALSFLLLLPYYFGAYVAQGVQNNVVLQSAMVALLLIHAVFYLGLIAFNWHQPLLLRALAALTGIAPALAASAALALAASYLARPMPLPAAGWIGAVGVLLAFAADRLTTITEIGGIRLRYAAIWVNMFFGVGELLIIVSAWQACGAW